MNKIIVLALLLGVGVGVAHAEDGFRVPVSDNRIADPGLQNAGVEVAVMLNSTTPALATDANGDTITDGMIYWIAFSTQSTLYAVLRDTGTANATSTPLLPLISRGDVDTLPIWKFDPPVPFTNGLSINLAPAASTPNSTGFDRAVIGIRKRR